MDKYICGVCSTIYDPDLGDKDEGVAPGTPFEKLPQEWTCPVCGSTKDKFKLLPKEEYEKLMEIKSTQYEGRNIMPTIENKDIEILNKALGAEQFAIAAYTLAAGTGLLSEGVIQVAKTFMSHHGQHAHKIRETILSLGGEAVKPLSSDEYAKKLPSSIIDEKSIIHYAMTLEKGAAITYLNVIPEFENSKLAQAAASILGDEAMHWSALRNALGLAPVHISFIPLSAGEVED